jgi:hypothetical protein
MRSHPFRMMIQEARLTQAMLLTGLEGLRTSDYDQPGHYYAAFFQLSIGLERLFKLVIILDHQARHDLLRPTDRQLRAVGHGLAGAYQTCRGIAARLRLTGRSWFEPDDLEGRVLGLLSAFADGARYYNLDELAGARRHADPIIAWSALHKEIANRYVSWNRQVEINNLAIQHCDRFRLFGAERGLDGEWRPQVDGVFLHELFRRSAGYCVWTLIQILQPFHGLLWALCEEIDGIDHSKGRPANSVPRLYEFFPFFLADRTSSIRRRRWVSFVG